MCVGFFYYFTGILIKCLPNPYLSEYHRDILIILFTLCMISFGIASKSSPGVITKRNVKVLEKKYKDDAIFMMYQLNKDCRTCKIPK